MESGGRFGDGFWRHLRPVSAFELSKTRARRCSGSAGSVCWVRVCSTFCKLFFGPVLSRIHLQFHEKSAQKMGSATDFRRGSWTFSGAPCRGRCTLLKWRLRRHLPPRPNWWRRSWKCPPVAPPAPAGSILVPDKRFKAAPKWSIRVRRVDFTR